MTPTDEPPRFLTVKQAAHILRVKEQTIRAWLREGKMRGQNPGGRRWFIPADAIAAMASGHSPAPTIPSDLGGAMDAPSPEAPFGAHEA